MPDVSVFDLFQWALLWVANVGVPDAYGQLTVSGTPMQLCPPRGVRWNKVHREVLTAAGVTVTLTEQVWLAVEVPLGSVLWLGKLDGPNGFLAQAALGPVLGLCEVVTSKWTVDLKGRKARNEVGLMRYRGTLPTQVGTATISQGQCQPGLEIDG